MIHVLNKGVQAIEEKGILKKVFCKHKNTVRGEHCSSIGMVRLNGSTNLTVCRDCGKILQKVHTLY